jgi:hypothetical protein
MTKTQPLTLLAVAAGALVACGGSRLLVGNDPGAAGSSGGAGASSSGTAGAPAPSSGAAGDLTTGAAGALGGAGPAGDIPTGAAGALGVPPLPISGVEAVTRIAQVLWQAPPDTAVLAQAQEGLITTKGDLSPVIHAMLADPRAAVGVGAFYRWWLSPSSDPHVPTRDATWFTADAPPLYQEMGQETETFATTVTLAMNGTFQTLMLAPFSFIDEDLASIYGVAGVTGPALRQVGLDPQQRAGLLTQPTILQADTAVTFPDPTRRGFYVVGRFFCTDIPPEPNSAPSTLMPAPGASMRQLLANATEANASCTACHGLVDPPGLALENFDAVGRWQTTENGVPIDTSGLRIENLQPPPTVSGPISLAQLIAGNDLARQCITRHWLAYILGPSQSPFMVDQGVLSQVQAPFEASGFSLQELIFAGLTSDAFLAPRP